MALCCRVEWGPKLWPERRIVSSGLSLQGHGHGLVEGRGLCLRLEVGDVAEDLGERSSSFAEVVRRRPLGNSSSNSTASVVSRNSSEESKSFEFLVLASSTRSMGERSRVIGCASRVIISPEISFDLVEEESFVAPSVSLREQRMENRQWEVYVADVVCGETEAMESSTSPEIVTSVESASDVSRMPKVSSSEFEA